MNILFLDFATNRNTSMRDDAGNFWLIVLFYKLYSNEQSLSSSIKWALFLIEEYTKSIGGCRGGLNPENEAGMTYFGPGVTPEECRNSCSQNSSCTAYLIPTELWPKSKDWCERFTSVGATGDGRTSFECFSKTSTLQGAGTFISQSRKFSEE